MVLKLHVFGPAFDVPSIDAECLAAILLFGTCLTLDEWALIPSSNPNANPFRRLPALQDGNTWIAGFDDIRRYLRDGSNRPIDLDQNLDEQSRADSEAYTAFIRSRGLPLLDLSLYVSSENYTTCTQKALAELLVWPESWILPHQLRAQAKRRSEHLGLSALDVDVAKQQQEEEENKGLSAHIPKSLRKPKQTVSAVLGRSAQQTKFRLDAVTDDFLDPLQEQLGDKPWLMGQEMHSVDCLAIAYLTLMQASGLPQGWLGDALSTKFSSLGAWARRHTSHLVGLSVSVNPRSGLPWTAVPNRTALETGSAIIEGIVSSIPGVRVGYAQAEVQRNGETGVGWHKQKQLAHTRVKDKQALYSQAVISAITTTSLLAWLLHLGILSLPGKTGASKRSFGEAGTLLGLR